MTATTPTSQLLSLLDPLLARIAALAPEALTSAEQTHALEATLEAEFPYAGPRVQAIGETLARGVADGWLANRGAPDSRFGRVAKASEATHGLSIDVVSMVGSAVEHTHPQGEVTLGFPARPTRDEKTCQFEGRDPAWVVMAPGSRHIPTVVGERMNLIYFLPQGAVEWHLE